MELTRTVAEATPGKSNSQLALRSTSRKPPPVEEHLDQFEAGNGISTCHLSAHLAWDCNAGKVKKEIAGHRVCFGFENLAPALPAS